MRDDIDNVNRFFMPPRLLKKRPSKAKLQRMRRRKRIRRLIALSVIVTAVIVLAVVFTDAGSDMVMTFAKDYVYENMNLNLKAESISGNPLKGYTMKNADVEDENGRKIFTAESLSGYLSLSSLMRGRMRLSEFSARGVSIDAEGSVNALRDMNVHYEADNMLSPALASEGTVNTLHDRNEADNMLHIFTSPAFADESEHANIIHLDRLRIRDGKINSRFITVNISEINADLRKSRAEINADINGLPLKGNIDIGDDSEVTSINRADMNLGSGKITAVGGLFNDDVFDIHIAAEELNLKEVTAIFPDKLSSDDFDGTLNLNLDVTGTKENPKVFGSVDYKGAKIYGFPIERMSANYHYSLNERIFTMNNIQASALSIPLQGEMSAMNLFGDNVMMRIKLDGNETNLDRLDEVLGIPELKSLQGKVTMFNVNINGSMNSLNGLVNVTSPAITYMGRTFSNIRLQMKLAGSSTGNVDGKFSFEGANGFIQGNIESILRGSNMNLTAKIADLDIKRVENIIPDYPAYNLSGNVTLSLNIRGRTDNPVVTGSLSSNEFSVQSQKVIKPAINFTFSFKDRTLTIDNTEGTLNGMPIAITGTLKPLPSSNPELDITAAGIKITGELNNPIIDFIASSDIKKEDSQDIELKVEVEVISEDTKTETESPDIKDIKEELSKDENTVK